MRTRHLALALAVPLAVGLGASAQQKRYTVGVSNGFVGSEWRTQMLDDLRRANEELKRAGLTNDLVIQSADVDVQGQVAQIRNLINRGVDGILINPNSQTALNPVIKEAADAGIKVVVIDQEVSAPGAVNVVIDQTEWARTSARWLAQTLGGKGNVVVVNGIAGHPANEARYNGVKEVFAQYPNIKVLNVSNADWDQAKGQQVMSSILAAQPNIDGVWTQDGMAEGVLRALAAAGRYPVVAGEARIGYMKLWRDTKARNANFKSFGVTNPPGVAASGLRVLVNLMQGKQFRQGILKGPSNNSLYVPIPGTVNDATLAGELKRYGGQPNSYALDGSITQGQANAFFR